MAALAVLGLIVGSAVEIIKCVWKPIGRHFSYLIHSHEKLDTLKKKIDKLKNRRDDIKLQLVDAQLQRKEPTNHVKGLLEEVDALEGEVEMMERNYSGDNSMRCLGRSCPDCRSAYRLGRNTEKKLQVVDELMEELQHPGDKLTVTPPPEHAVEMITTSLGNQTKAKQMVQKIIDYLGDEKVGMIGIYGMGGVGKTTLMQHVNNQVPNMLFDHVIWVTVSSKMDFKDIQNQIAERLILNLSDNPHVELRAGPILVRLKQKKCLLILDDVWEAPNLSKLGVPLKNAENSNGCKIVLMTRSLEVCNAMPVDVAINVEVLPWEEAWKLFREKSGDVVVSPSIQPIAETVAKECGGLPLAIITVGKAMRGKSTPELWKNVLQALRKASPSEIQGMESQVFNCLKFSYENLEKNLQSCFLYFCLFPEDASVGTDVLVEYWIAEGLVEYEGSLEDSINKGHAVVEKLKDACLLQVDYFDESNLIMHDLLVDMGRWITSSSSRDGPKFLVKNKMGLTEIPEEANWREVERMSLTENEIEILPEKPLECHKLQTLFLHGNQNLKSIPSGFFEQMHALRVLDLSYTMISSLPSSLSGLQNLRYLNLRMCENLVEVPPLGGLHQLQMLDLSGTPIVELPQGMEGLSKLKVLDVSYTSKLKNIQSSVIARLTCLERLSIFKDLDEVDAWTIIDLEAIACLKHLKRLSITIGGPVSLEWFMRSPLMDCIEHLSVSHHDYNIQGFWFTGVNDLNGLKGLHFNDCSKIEKILVGEDIKGPCFRSLTQLWLWHLPQLYRIWEGQIPCGSFGKLQMLWIRECDNLKYLFPCDMLQHLQNLTFIEVKACLNMEVLIEGQVAERVALPKLVDLRLISLPQLRTLCVGILDLPCLKERRIEGCPMLRDPPAW